MDGHSRHNPPAPGGGKPYGPQCSRFRRLCRRGAAGSQAARLCLGAPRHVALAGLPRVPVLYGTPDLLSRHGRPGARYHQVKPDRKLIQPDPPLGIEEWAWRIRQAPPSVMSTTVALPSLTESAPAEM